MAKKITILSLLISLIVSADIYSQESASLDTVPLQVSFVYPIGSNGTNTNAISNFSVNLLQGTNGGVDGAEFGGFLNIDKHFVKGAQFAGFMNINGGWLYGAQFAGFMNINGQKAEGLQASGFMNINDDVLNGVQGSGFLNINSKKLTGIQGSGFMNIAGAVHGIQGSGFMNIASDSSKVIQASGFGNFVNGSCYGIQGSSFINVVTEDIVGVQGSGFLNIARDVKGFQGSSFLNIAEKVEGVQLSGFLNVCDSINGVPFGIISVVKENGYRKLEFWGAESFYFNAAYKMGVKEFYNIFTFGSQPTRRGFRYGMGYGIGSELDIHESSYVNFDLTATHINESEDVWTDDLNLLNQLRVMFGFRSNEHMSFYFGPTYNVLVSSYAGPNDRIGSDIAPWNMFRTVRRNHSVEMWVGFNAGIKLF
jgi:hypothetical protein